MKKKIFFAIEGLDGVGKTTLINNLKKHGFNTYKSPHSIYAPIQENMNKVIEANLFYFLSSYSYFIETHQGSKPFIFDRYIFSSIFRYIYRTNFSVEHFYKTFKKFQNIIILPTITFFLVLDYEKRMQRINKRNDTNQKDDLSPKYNNCWTQAMNNYNLSTVFFLDANNSEEELLSTVIDKIKKLTNQMEKRH